MMILVRFTTVSNRAHEVSVDIAATSWAQLHAIAADALDLDLASLKLTPAGTSTRLDRLSDAPIGDSPDAATVFFGGGLDCAVAVIHVIGVRCRVAASTPRRQRSVEEVAPPTPASASNGEPSSTPPPPAAEVSAAHVATVAGAPASPSAAIRSEGGVVESSPTTTGAAPVGRRVAVPPVEVLRAVVREVEAAPNGPRARRVITTNPVIESMGAQVRKFAEADEADAALQELVERLHSVCPEFVEGVIRAYPRDFLDAINGVVASISMPYAAAASNGVPGSAFAATLAEAIANGFGAGGGAGDGDDDDDGSIAITGDAVSANALIDILSQAILAEIANQTGIEFPLAPPHGGGDEDDDGEEDDGGDDGEDGSGENDGGLSAVHKAAARDLNRMHRELEMATSFAAANRHSAAASHFHSVWCVLRRRVNQLEGTTSSGNADAASTAALLRDIGGLMVKAILRGLRSLALSTRQRLVTLLDGTLLTGMTTLGANSPNSAHPPAASVAASGSSGFAESAHSNAVLSTLDDAILCESFASAAVATFVGDAAVAPDAPRALSVTLWLRDIRRLHDVCFGLLEIDRPQSTAASRGPMGHLGLDGAPFGTGAHTPKALVDLARAFLAGHGGSRRVAIAAVEAELADRKYTAPTDDDGDDDDVSGPHPAPPAAAANAAPFRRSAPPAPATVPRRGAARVDAELSSYDAEITRMTRVCTTEGVTAVVYSGDFCFFDENANGTELSPFITLQALRTARSVPSPAGRSVAFVIQPSGLMRARLITGVLHTVRPALAKASVATGAMGCSDALSDLSRVLLRPLVTLGLFENSCTSAPAVDDAAPAATFTFVTMFAAANESDESGDASSASPVRTREAASDAKSKSGGSSGDASSAASSATAALLAVPFHALPIPSAAASSTLEPAARLVDRFAVTVTPTVDSFLAAWGAAEAPIIRARITGGPAMAQRQPWLTASAARVLNVRRQRDRGAEERTRWTVLADTSVPRASSGIATDLFVATAANAAAARSAFAVADASTVASALVSLWRPPRRSNNGGGPGGGSSPASSPHKAPLHTAATDDQNSDQDDDDDDGSVASGDAASAADDQHRLARAFRIAVVRRLLDDACAATHPVTIAAAFRTAVLAARRQYPDAGVDQWAPLVLLHSGRRLDALRFHVRGLRDEATERASALRSRLTIRGPLSVAESRNVRYVQQHNIPSLFDALCRELLASRPEGDTAVLTTLIAALEGIAARGGLPSPPGEAAAEESSAGAMMPSSNSAAESPGGPGKA